MHSHVPMYATGLMGPRPGGFLPTGPPPMPYGMPPPRPMPPAPVSKATTVYVGKIAATVEDSVIKKLLEACGSVKSWKLMKEPDSNAHKGFGFCDFYDAEGVLRAVSRRTPADSCAQPLVMILLLEWLWVLHLDAFHLRRCAMGFVVSRLAVQYATMVTLHVVHCDNAGMLTCASAPAQVRLLNGLSLDGQELLLKPNTATEKYLEQYQRDREQRAMERAEARVLRAIKQEEEQKLAQQQLQQQEQQQNAEAKPEPMAVDSKPAAVKQEGDEEEEPQQRDNGAVEVKQEGEAADEPTSSGDAAVMQEVKQEGMPAESKVRVCCKGAYSRWTLVMQ